jgi:FlgD Ig-like domain
MKHQLYKRVSLLISAGMLLLAAMVSVHTAVAEEPRLAVRLADGESAVYAVTEIETMTFDEDGTLMVATADGVDSYEAALIQRIDFLFDFSSVNDPTEAAELIKAIHLFQNQPNPFSPKTQIGFELPRGGKMELGIYSPEGRLIRKLVSGVREAGTHSVVWDGLDDSGRAAGSGVYFYNLRAPGIEESRRMILLP